MHTGREAERRAAGGQPRMSTAGDLSAPEQSGIEEGAAGEPAAGASQQFEPRSRARYPLIIGAIAAVLVAEWPSAVSLAGFWNEIHDYRFGFLIAAIAAGWCVLVLRRATDVEVRPSLPAAALLAITLLGWLIAYNANSELAHQLLLPVSIWLAVYAAAGRPLAARLLPPILFVYFAVPLWEQFVPLLQWMSVRATESILGLLGVPAHVSEYTVQIPAGRFNIVEGCSGKKFFMIALAIAYLAGFVNALRWRRFLLLMTAAGVLAILANWARIVIVIYLGHITNMRHYFVSVEHTSLGNAIFIVLLIAITFLARLFSQGSAADREVRFDLLNAPLTGGMSRILATAVPFLLLALTFAVGQVRTASAGVVGELKPLPLATGKWQGPLPSGAEWFPHYVKADEELRASYASAAGAVEVYANVYGEQSQGRELIYFRNSMAGPEGWKLAWDQSHSTLTGNRKPAVPLLATRMNAEDQQWVVAWVYDVGGWHTTNELMAQLAYGWRSMLHPVPAGVIAMSAPCGQNCEAARQLVATFWDDMSPQLLAVMPNGTNL